MFLYGIPISGKTRKRKETTENYIWVCFHKYTFLPKVI